MIIYTITNKINGKTYVGLSRFELSKRIAEHINRSKSHVANALRKYGIQSFVIKVVDHADDYSTLQEKEKYWIKRLKCKHPKGYNHTDGGDGLVNPSKKVRNKIAKKVKSLGKSPDFTFEGHRHSKSSKKKISESLKKTMSDPRVKAKMSASAKGKSKSEEHKRKIGEANHGKLKGRVPWNKGVCMKDHDPAYVNSMQGKKRPDLSEMNRNRMKWLH